MYVIGVSFERLRLHYEDYILLHSLLGSTKLGLNKYHLGLFEHICVFVDCVSLHNAMYNLKNLRGFIFC